MTTFVYDLYESDEARATLDPLFGKDWSCCEEASNQGHAVTLKAK